MNDDLGRPFKLLDADERNLVFDFVGYFSRMEYSLKRSGYYFPNGRHKGEVDWDTFATTNQQAFEGCDLLDLCPTLYENPPLKEVMDDHGEMGWKVVPPQGNQSGLKNISLSLRRVRNNLFHGSKFHGERGHGFERSSDLLKESIALIKYLASLDSKVVNFWLYD